MPRTAGGCGGDAVQAGEDGADCLGVGVPGGDGFCDPARAVQQVARFELAYFALWLGEFTQALELKGAFRSASCTSL